MDIQSIVTLIDAVSKANIKNFQVEEGNFKLSMDKYDTPSFPFQNVYDKSPLTALQNKNNESQVIAQPVSTVVPTTSFGVSPQPVSTIVPTTSFGVPTQSMQAAVNVQEAQTVQETPNNKDYKVVKSPIVGTFYSAAGPDEKDFVKVGDKVSKGQVLCIIEAMKLMNDIESDFDGEIVEILVKNEQPVEFGQELFYIK